MLLCIALQNPFVPSMHINAHVGQYQHPLKSNTLNETNDSSMDLGYVKDSPDGAISNNKSFSP